MSILVNLAIYLIQLTPSIYLIICKNYWSRVDILQNKFDKSLIKKGTNWGFISDTDIVLFGFF